MHFGGIFWHLLNRLKIGHTIHARKALSQVGQQISPTGKTSPRFQSNPEQQRAESSKPRFFGQLDQEGKSTCFSVPILLPEFSSFGNAHFRYDECPRVPTPLMLVMSAEWAFTGRPELLTATWTH